MMKSVEEMFLVALNCNPILIVPLQVLFGLVEIRFKQMLNRN